ncbi:YbaY family lipoprotein [Defluviimonas aestuarii]|uniref:YbaY family lipoprotein n=1 Tax=Albidovulum aestuarii TaxID=1130726 RepID=UPI003B00828C
MRYCVKPKRARVSYPSRNESRRLEYADNETVSENLGCLGKDVEHARPFRRSVTVLVALGSPNIRRGADENALSDGFLSGTHCVSPVAQLDVRLLEVVNADGHVGAIASQGFEMTEVPMTVSLSYDPRGVDGESGYPVTGWTAAVPCNQDA